MSGSSKKLKFKKIAALIIGVLIIAFGGYLYLSGTFSKKYTSEDIQENTIIGSDVEELTVKSIVEQLTDFDNRFINTKENAKSTLFIRNYFKSLGLEPYNESSYFQKFEFEYYGDFFKENGVAENVIGKIKGEDSSKAIIISAHLDTVKTRGVLDNTSGVAVMLEISKSIADYSKENEMPVDIIFVAYNAEEQGIIGSEVLYEELNSNYKDMYNINMDCIGLKGEPIGVASGNDRSMEVYEDFIPYLEKYNVEVIREEAYDRELYGSDHFHFEDNNRAALFIASCNSTGLIHTDEDNNLDILDYDMLENIAKAVSDFVIETNGRIY